MVECPTCHEDRFDTDRAMKLHHYHEHGESIAKDTGECVRCGVEFEYYPSNRRGKLCHTCSDKNADDWGDSMNAVLQSNGDDGYYHEDTVRRIKDRVLQIKKACRCGRCGFEDWRALEFHHYKGDKQDEISNMAYEASTTWEDVKGELAKCELICSNCHKIEHATG